MIKNATPTLTLPVVIYGCPEYPLPGETSRLKVGVTLNPLKRFNDMLGHRPDLNLSSIHRRDITNDPAIFRPTKTNTFLIEKVDGKNVEPDEFIHKMLRLKGYKNPDKGNAKGKHTNSEVFINLDWKEVDNCISVAINHKWNWKACKKALVSKKPSFIPYLWQAWNIARRADTRRTLVNEDMIAEFSCPRFGKTLRELYEFLTSDANLLVLVQYNLSPVTSFVTELESWAEFADVEMYDATDPAVEVSSLPTTLINGKKVIAVSLCGEKERDKNTEICEYLRRYAIAPKTVIKMDEVDFGSATDKSQYKLKQLQKALPGVKIDIFSGTGEDKVNFKMELSDRVKASAIRISYIELLHIRNRTHYLFQPQYRNSLDSVRNKCEIVFLDSLPTSNYHTPDKLVNPIFYGLTVGQDILQEIEKVHREKSDDDPRLGFSYTKINKMPLKYASVHQNIWRQFLGIGKLKGCRLDYRQCTKGREVRVIIAWAGGVKKKNLKELAEVLNNDAELSKEWVFHSICGPVGIDSKGHQQKWGFWTKGGTPAMNNREAEVKTNALIDQAKSEGKGVVFLAMHIGQRSFSVPRIDATVFYRDDLPVDSAEQKLSRVLTPGLDYYGNDKLQGHIFDLSLTPNSSLIENYIYSEINEQARAGIPVKVAATRLYEVIDVFQMNQLGMVEKKVSFSDTDYSSFVKAGRSMYARTEIRDMVLGMGDMDDFMEFVKWASTKKSFTKQQRDVLKDMVDNAALSNAQTINAHNDTDNDEEPEEKPTDHFTQAVVLARRLLYESVLNMAAIYCSVKGMKLIDIEKNNVKYSEILGIIKTNTEAFKMFMEHFKFASEEQAKKILGCIMRWPLDDKLTANLHSVILETSFGKDLGEDDINSYFYADTDEGKIHTPMKLVNEIMGKWAAAAKAHKDDPSGMCFLDPHCKTGTFLRWVHQMFTERGVSETDIQKQVGGIENDPVYLVIARHISGIENIQYKNLLDDNELAIFIHDNMKKFDAIVGNSPYQAPANKERKGGSPKSIWEKFVHLSLSCLKDGGYLCYIHPSRWRKPEDELWSVLGSKQMEWLKIYDNAAATDLFGVGTTADCYVLKNIPYVSPTTVIDCDGKEHTIDFREWAWLPSAEYELIKSILAKDNDEKCELLYDCVYHNQRKDIVNGEEPNGAFVNPCVNHTKKNGVIEYLYSNTKDRGHFGITKVIIADNGHVRPINDSDGKLGMTECCFAITSVSKSDCERVCNALSSDKFAKVVWATKWGNYRTEYRMFRHFRKDFWKDFLPNESHS